MERPAAPSPPGRQHDVEGVVADVAALVPLTDGCTTPAGDPDEPVSSDDPASCPETPPDVIGTVLVEGKSVGCGISFSVTVRTQILRRTPDGFEEARFGELAVGQRAAAWASGPIAESCPGQAGAGVILIQAGQGGS